MLKVGRVIGSAAVSGYHLTIAFMKLKHTQTPPRQDSHTWCVWQRGH